MEHDITNIIDCGRYLVELTGAVLHQRIPAEKPEKVSFEDVFTLAKMHCLETMSYEGVSLLQQKPDEELMRRWRNSQTANIAKNLMQRDERERILDAMTKRGIDVLPLKGCLLIEMYPKPEYREMSDLDILFRREKAEQVRDCMQSFGYECERFGVTNEDSYRRIPFMHVEMHHDLISKGVMAEQLREYYRDPWSRAIPDEGKVHRYHFSWEDYYIYMLAHFYKHFSGGGSGIRNVMDIHVFRSLYADRLDMEYVDRELAKMDLIPFRQEMEQLAEQWYGEDPDPDAVPGDLEETIFTSGAYGLRYTSRTRKLDWMEERYDGRLPVRLHYMLWLLFPDYDRILVRYPRFYGWPRAALPVMWVCRIWDKVFHDRERITGNIRVLKEHRAKKREQ